MADPRDLENLARRFLDLWQDQAAASVADPALAEWMARLMAAPGGAGGPRPAEQPQGDTRANAFAAATTGAAAAAHASRPGGELVDQLARRIAICEERLAALESRLEPEGGGARRPSRRKRP